jgi:hypothetical protein
VFDPKHRGSSARRLRDDPGVGAARDVRSPLRIQRPPVDLESRAVRSVTDVVDADCADPILDPEPGSPAASSPKWRGDSSRNRSVATASRVCSSSEENQARISDAM